jgi:hypothetical protein
LVFTSFSWWFFHHRPSSYFQFWNLVGCWKNNRTRCWQKDSPRRTTKEYFVYATSGKLIGLMTD